MTLLANWKDVLRRAWSVRLIVLAAILSGIEAALLFLPLPVPPGTFALLTCIVTMAAFVARIMAQKNLSGDDR